MRDFRELIQKQGLKKARSLAETPTERASVDAAYAMMEQPRNDVIFTSRSISTLPHKRGKGLKRWERFDGEFSSYVWEGGSFDDVEMGVPYGAKSRIILMYLLNRAVKTNSHRLTVGSTMNEWAREICGATLGGMTYRLVSEHSRRIACCKLAIRAGNGNGTVGGEPVPLVDKIQFDMRETVGYDRNSPDTPYWMKIFPKTIILNQALVSALMRELVPVRATAIRQLSNNSAAIDLYIRLAARLPKLQRRCVAPWSGLAERFASGYKSQRQLKPAVHDLLQLVSAVYPEADVAICSEGIVMGPSPPAIESEPRQRQIVLTD